MHDDRSQAMLPAGGAGRGARRARLGQEQVVLLIAAGLALVFGLILPGFASWGNALALLRSISVLGVLALGMAVVIIGRGIDLSQIAIALVSAGIAAILATGGLALPAALAAGLAVAFALGLVNGIVVAWLGVPALFATLASAFLFIGVARAWLFESAIISLPAADAAFAALGGTWLGLPAPVIVFAACALATHLFLSRTTLGRFIYAHGDNAEAARLAGLPVHGLTLLEYALSAGVGYLAGLVMVASTAMVNLNIAGSTLVFEVILVAVLGGVSLTGGRGGVGGVLAAALLVGVLLNGMILLDLDYQLQNILKGGVLLTAIVLDNWLHPYDEETARQGV